MISNLIAKLLSTLCLRVELSPFFCDASSAGNGVALTVEDKEWELGVTLCPIVFDAFFIDTDYGRHRLDYSPQAIRRGFTAG